MSRYPPKNPSYLFGQVQGPEGQCAGLPINQDTMAYNEQLAARVRQYLLEYDPVEELRMMGGLCFMYKDKMLVGVVGDDLMCRVDPALIPDLVESPGCRQMSMGGRQMKGYLLVDDTAHRRPGVLEHWLKLTLDFNDRAKSSRKKT